MPSRKNLRTSARGTMKAATPLRAQRIGNKTAKDNVARLCERMSGLIFFSDAASDEFEEAPSQAGRCPVKAARPSVAETPQRNAAVPMKR